ncbi:MAG: tRNA pseudouridine(38-40) synthase TruA [Bacteroidales bacterium]|nr:tRNA pseudouridine(38-40) synthase TruA [Bacteroidales bacterium]
MRYKIVLSYDGTSFSGWQIQPNAPSVQECLQAALSTLMGEEISVTGAGRTDAGVHAIRYAAHFDSFSGRLGANVLVCKLNAILPVSVRVHEVSEVPDDFHARFDAVSRSYMYLIDRGRNPFAVPWSWQCGYKLDMDAMNVAARCLLGTHDFSCFEKTGGNNKTSVCTVTEASWSVCDPFESGLPFLHGSDLLVFRVSADRFLRNMVRAIVGTLVEVGRGRRTPDSIPALLDSHDRCCAGESVPARGLFLTDVEY